MPRRAVLIRTFSSLLWNRFSVRKPSRRAIRQVVAHRAAAVHLRRPRLVEDQVQKKFNVVLNSSDPDLVVAPEEARGVVQEVRVVSVEGPHSVEVVLPVELAVGGLVAADVRAEQRREIWNERQR